MPAMIDSSGNPGIAGTVRGVTMLLVDVAADVARELLVLVVVEVVDVIDADVDATLLWVLVEVVTTLLEAELVLELLVVDARLLLVEVAEVVGWVLLELVATVVVAPITGGLGGSRWKMPDRDMAASTPPPTANPSVADVRYTDRKPKPVGERPGASPAGTVLAQEFPSQCAITGFDNSGFAGLVPSSPTAQPSPLPEPTPYVSTYTDRRTVPTGA
jgi:hypothetical protein